MKSKLIMFEGIPGSGKSTFAQKASLFLIEKNINNQLYQEFEDLNPANLDGYAVIESSKLDDVIAKFQNDKDKICSNAIPISDYVLIRLKKVFSHENSAFQYLANYFVWGGKIDYTLFKQMRFYARLCYRHDVILRKTQRRNCTIY